MAVAGIWEQRGDSITVLFCILLTIFLVAFLADLLSFLFFKRADVTFGDAIFNFPVRHGALWFLRKPDAYFKKEVLPFVIFFRYLAVLSFIGILVVLIVGSEKIR